MWYLVAIEEYPRNLIVLMFAFSTESAYRYYLDRLSGRRDFNALTLGASHGLRGRCCFNVRRASTNFCDRQNDLSGYSDSVSGLASRQVMNSPLSKRLANGLGP
jgi:hypothetical protein